MGEKKRERKETTRSDYSGNDSAKKGLEDISSDGDSTQLDVISPTKS